MRVLTVEEIELYLEHAKGDLKDFAIIATETGCRPAEILGLRTKDLHAEEHYIHVEGTKTARSRRDVPLTACALDVLQRRSQESPNGYIFPLRRPKTKNHGILHISSLRKAHDRIVEEHFADSPFVLYDFRHTFATRCVQAGCDLPTLADLLGHSDISTTMRYVHPAKQQKVAAVERLEKYVNMARRFQDMQEEPKYDEWGMPIDESRPQNPPQVVEIPDLTF